jgi:zinc D-Ala-D-Ala carboxypeptidase
MSNSLPVRTPRARHRSAFLAVLLAVATLTAVLVCRSLVGSSSGAAPMGAEPSAHGLLPGGPPQDRHRALGAADGELPDGVTPFDDAYPAVARLDRALLAALRDAATDAEADGVEIEVNSGWRSPAYQERLLEEAVSRYGSMADAARWVATPATSPHVAGDAVDVGGTDAASWLAEHGAGYGLCEIYRNEPWHYELRPEAVDHGCPARYADPTEDPRMQR